MGMDVQASVNNLPHVDRIQSDSHRLPVVHQEYNSHVVRDEAARRTVMPVQPDKIEGKITDPHDRAPQNRSLRGRRKKKPASRHRARPDSGSIIDVDA